MALPQDGQDANGLTKVTQIPAGKELMFIDPTTNEGGIITLEDLTKQILNGLASQAFALDAGQMTLLAALNKLNSDKTKLCINSNISNLNDFGKAQTQMLSGIAYNSALNYIPDEGYFANIFYIPSWKNYGVQLACIPESGNIYVRMNKENKWGSWIKLN